MTIDERLESLAQIVERIAQNRVRQDQRLESVVQTVELLGHMQMKNEEWLAKSEDRLAKSKTLLAEVIESINSLARIAHVRAARKWP